jgi:hypothetical protein
MVDRMSLTPKESLPLDADAAQSAAKALGFVIAEPCLPGVVANLLILSRHAEHLIPQAQEK